MNARVRLILSWSPLAVSMAAVLAVSVIAGAEEAPVAQAKPKPTATSKKKEPAMEKKEAEAAKNPAVAGRIPDDEIPKTDVEWRKRLTNEQFQVARKKGTERAFTGKYWDSKKKGSYRCVCCGEPLFTSGEKFDSGCGWPSFSKALDDQKIAEHEDLTLGMHRIEVTCKRCGAHLGHVFNDGPPPTGLRYCINSASLVFDEE